MRKLSMVVSMLLLLTLAACGVNTPKKPVTATTAATATTVTTMVAAVTEAPEFPKTGYINGASVNVRQTPGTEKEPIGGMKRGQELTLLGREGDWFQIAFAWSGGETAYVNAQFVQDTPPAADSTTATTVETLPE